MWQWAIDYVSSGMLGLLAECWEASKFTVCNSLVQFYCKPNFLWLGLKVEFEWNVIFHFCHDWHCENNAHAQLFCNTSCKFVFYEFYSDYLFKLLLIGDSGVGKSCLLLRFAVRSLFCLIMWHIESLLTVSVYLFKKIGSTITFMVAMHRRFITIWIIIIQ